MLTVNNDDDDDNDDNKKMKKPRSFLQVPIIHRHSFFILWVPTRFGFGRVVVHCRLCSATKGESPLKYFVSVVPTV